MMRHTPKLTVLLLGGLLASSAGCTVLGLPSYRTDAGLPFVVCVEIGPANGPMGTEVVDGGEYCESPTSVLPPLPGWLSTWREKRPARPARLSSLPTHSNPPDV
ncbi:MAG: hypothetical protein R3C53_05405 [Pirellulaceae bacterium]